ncbi:serine/threonine-protein kinase [Pseudomonas sp. G(2018)]|uniref:serine/threonine-protein kinase n=1 Tax=Pseudomonas sp. G(2018) TaxID=2502242 RepID=UPI0010F5C94F|nr:serine/threonine-protein kinase [Pseudomonas sp. G(2018)]
MSEPASTPEKLPVCEGAVADLTYFAFAKPATASQDAISPQASAVELPEVLSGRYRIERLLGAGGMGVVYRARDLLHEQFGDREPCIALKMLGEELADSPDASALLYSEFALTRRLHHPNVLRLNSFEVDTRCRRAFFTMELMRGLTLDKLLCERPLGISWPELRDVALPLLDALAHVHSRGVLHGDLKPSNVMLSEEGVRLFDFGLGRADESVIPGLPKLSRDRFNAWTPGYAAPELLEDQPLSVASDIYAVACVLYELAGGKHPFRRWPSTRAQDEHLDRELRAPRYLPKHCWPALQKALSYDAAQRTITAQELYDAFNTQSSWLRRWAGR